MLARLRRIFKRSAPADERFLLHKGYSGIGNKVSSFLQAVVYARLSGRALLVDWNDFRYSPDDLLARCDAFVFSSRSSYGWLAKMVSDRPEERSFDVEAPRHGRT